MCQNSGVTQTGQWDEDSLNAIVHQMKHVAFNSDHVQIKHYSMTEAEQHVQFQMSRVKQ